MNWIRRVFGLKSSFSWAIRQMDKGKIVKPKNITGAVKYRLSVDGQKRLEWGFFKEMKDAEWDRANLFMRDILVADWEIWSDNA